MHIHTQGSIEYLFSIQTIPRIEYHVPISHADQTRQMHWGETQASKTANKPYSHVIA